MDPTPLKPLPADFALTVAGLHRVAEQIVAPARKPDNEIALEAAPGGFGTPEFEYEGSRQRVRVEGAELVRELDGSERRAGLGSLAEAAAILDDLLPGGELSSDPLQIDPDAALALGAWYELGAIALGRLMDGAAAAAEASAPRLWPEHFDLAIEFGSEAGGARANYGLSPGDENHPEPYLYVGPWSAAVSGGLWQASGFTGAEMSYAELLGTPDPEAAASEFFETRRDALASFGRSEG